MRVRRDPGLERSTSNPQPEWGTLLRVLATEHLARYVTLAADRPEDPGKLIKFILFQGVGFPSPGPGRRSVHVLASVQLGRRPPAGRCLWDMGHPSQVEYSQGSTDGVCLVSSVSEGQRTDSGGQQDGTQAHPSTPEKSISRRGVVPP